MIQASQQINLKHKMSNKRHIVESMPFQNTTISQPEEQEHPGLTEKEAWWAGCRAGLGLPSDTHRAEVANKIPKKES